MLETSVLYIHLGGALITGSACMIGLVSILGKTFANPKTMIQVLNIFSVLQIGTGAILSLLYQQSPLTFCSNIGIYLGIVLAVQVGLLLKNSIRLQQTKIVISHSINIALVTIFSAVLSII